MSDNKREVRFQDTTELHQRSARKHACNKTKRAQVGILSTPWTVRDHKSNSQDAEQLKHQENKREKTYSSTLQTQPSQTKSAGPRVPRKCIMQQTHQLHLSLESDWQWGEGGRGEEGGGGLLVPVSGVDEAVGCEREQEGDEAIRGKRLTRTPNRDIMKR